MTRAWKVSIALVLTLGWAATMAVTPAAAAGRWKKAGDKCVWDAKDSGPNQCTPPAGRYKKNGDRCVWEQNDDGPDQCKPVKGRFGRRTAAGASGTPTTPAPTSAGRRRSSSKGLPQNKRLTYTTMRSCWAHEEISAPGGRSADPYAVSQSEGRADRARAPALRGQ